MRKWAETFSALTSIVLRNPRLSWWTSLSKSDSPAPKFQKRSMPSQLGSGIDVAQFERIFVASLFLLSVRGSTRFGDVRTHHSNRNTLTGYRCGCVGVTSQTVGKFKSLDQCKAAANDPSAGGAISDLSLTRGVYWYCAPAGKR